MIPWTVNSEKQGKKCLLGKLVTGGVTTYNIIWCM